MATNEEFIKYVCEQVRSPFEVRYKKMFGEYMVYVNDKPVLLVCDNTVFVKKVAQLAELMAGAECGVPYGGAKDHYVLDIDNAELAERVVCELERVAPLPKKRAEIGRAHV